MKKLFFAVIAAAGLALPALAEVTLKQTTGGKGLGMSGKSTGTTYIKGNRMRSDIALGDKVQTTIFDIDAQKMYIFDSKKKEADVWDMETIAEEISKGVDMSNARTSLKPNGQTKQVSGHTAAGYDMEISMPSGVAGSKDLNMTVTMAGPVWIVKDAPGTADFGRFYKTAVDKGWIFSDPRAAKGQPGQAKAMAEMYRQIAEIGGIPYESDMQIKISGSGPMAAILARMGSVSFSNVVDSVATDSLPDDLFAPPAGYNLKAKK